MSATDLNVLRCTLTCSFVSQLTAQESCSLADGRMTTVCRGANSVSRLYQVAALSYDSHKVPNKVKQLNLEKCKDWIFKGQILNKCLFDYCQNFNFPFDILDMVLKPSKRIEGSFFRSK